MSVQKLRLKHGWSQQQLADASGLSARTVQRIEAGQPASTETLKSLAAVFEVDFATLNPEPMMNTSTTNPTDQAERDAFDQVRKLRHFYLHLIRYVAVVLAEAWRVFGAHRGTGFLSPAWEKREVEKRLGRSL